MKKFNQKILLVLSFILVLTSCSNHPNVVNNSSGFNIPKFADLVKRTQNSQNLENQINSPNNEINNLDLNNDGNVDYLRVVEGQGQIQVIDDVSQTNSQVIATLSISNNSYSINGSPNYCGSNYYYHDNTLRDALILSYLLSPHPYYHSIYHYGYYPTSYHSYHTITRTTYVKTYTKPTINNNVNSNVNTTNNRSSLSNPMKSQRQFQSRTTPYSGNTSGFGNKTPTTSVRSGFGSSSSGFGSSSRSVSSGFGHSYSGFGKKR